MSLVYVVLLLLQVNIYISVVRNCKYFIYFNHVASYTSVFKIRFVLIV